MEFPSSFDQEQGSLLVDQKEDGPRDGRSNSKQIATVEGGSSHQAQGSNPKRKK